MHRSELGSEPSHGGRMAAPTEGVEPGLRIVALDQLRRAGSHARRIRTCTSDPLRGRARNGMTTVLGDDPARVSIDVHADNGASSPSTTTDLRLDE